MFAVPLYEDYEQHCNATIHFLVLVNCRMYSLLPRGRPESPRTPRPTDVIQPYRVKIRAPGPLADPGTLTCIALHTTLGDRCGNKGEFDSQAFRQC